MKVMNFIINSEVPLCKISAIRFMNHSNSAARLASQLNENKLNLMVTIRKWSGTQFIENMLSILNQLLLRQVIYTHKYRHNVDNVSN